MYKEDLGLSDAPETPSSCPAHIPSPNKHTLPVTNPHCEVPIRSTPIPGLSKPQLTSDSRIGPCKSPCATRAKEKDRPHGSYREPRPAALSSYGKGATEKTSGGWLPFPKAEQGRRNRGLMPSCYTGSCCHRRKESKAMKQIRQHRSGCSKCLIANSHPPSEQVSKFAPTVPQNHELQGNGTRDRGKKREKTLRMGHRGSKASLPTPTPKPPGNEGGEKEGRGQPSALTCGTSWLRTAPHRLPRCHRTRRAGSPASGETPPSDIALATPPFNSAPFSHAPALTTPL